MTREDAWKQIYKLLGKNAAIEVGKSISSPEDRARAQESRRFLEGRKQALSEQLEARRKWLLDNDEEYQALVAELKPVREQVKNLTGEAFYYKFRAMTIDRTIPSFPIAHIEAEGDSWREVIDKIKAKKAKA